MVINLKNKWKKKKNSFFFPLKNNEFHVQIQNLIQALEKEKTNKQTHTKPKQVYSPKAIKLQFI